MSDIIRISSITQGHEILGLPKPTHPLVSLVDYRKTPLRKRNFGDARIVIDLFNISMKGSVSGSIGYGRNSYDFEEGTMIFTSPGQVLTSVDHGNEMIDDGWSLLFHPDLLRKSELGRTIENYSFFSYEVHEALHLSDEERLAITDIAEKIEREYSGNIDKHSQKLIISNIELMLDYCTRYYDRQFYTRANLNSDVVSRFESLLKDYYTTGQALETGVPSVRYCGTQMAMSPNYLSDLLKKETGRSAQEHIHGYVINRAKNRLLGSVDSISQIAYSLGFEYPQHFSKIFKSKTGMSPAEYRSMN